MIRIALVEDLPMIQEGISLLLNNIRGFKITHVFSTGEEFIDDILSLDVDIVLTDIDLPGMDGVSATKIALSLRPELKIIALTMYNDRKYYYEMVTAGAKGFVLKHTTSKELVTAVKEVHAGKSYFSQELLKSIIINMQGIEQELLLEKRKLLKLDDRDVELMTLICKGYTNKELSEKLCLSVRTIEGLKTRLIKNTNTKNTSELIVWAIKNKIVII